MKETDFDQKLKQVAVAYHMTPEQFRQRATQAIAQSRLSGDPAVQALWASIPHRGQSPTLEEFVLYLHDTLPRPFPS